MVKAGDIGKNSRKFIKDDFFTGNEIKVNQTGCGKNTTTFKLGDNMKADHKVELTKVNFFWKTNLWSFWKFSKNNIFSNKVPTWLRVRPDHFEAELGRWLRGRGKDERRRRQDHRQSQHQHGQTRRHRRPLHLQDHRVQQVSVWLKFLFFKNFFFHKIEKRIENLKKETQSKKQNFRDISGINTCIDLSTGLKGLSALNATNVGIGFEKNGFQLGVTGTIPNLAAPSFEKAKYAVGMAGCPHFQVTFLFKTEKIFENLKNQKRKFKTFFWDNFF